MQTKSGGRFQLLLAAWGLIKINKGKKMKRSYFLLVALLVCSCEPVTYVYYHSTAKLSQTSFETKTKMKLIYSNEYPLSGYSICVAKDNSDTDKRDIYYLFIAPNNYTTGSINSLNNLIIRRGVPLTPNVAKKILTALNTIVEKWDSKSEMTEGEFYEFSTIQEQDIYQQTDSVISYDSAFKIHFENINSKTKGTIYFGLDNTWRAYEVNTKSKAVNLIKTMELAFEELNKLGYKE